jgi:hypothetical protein
MAAFSWFCAFPQAERGLEGQVGVRRVLADRHVDAADGDLAGSWGDPRVQAHLKCLNSSGLSVFIDG